MKELRVGLIGLGGIMGLHVESRALRINTSKVADLSFKAMKFGGIQV